MFGHGDHGGQWKLRAGIKCCDNGVVCEGESVFVDTDFRFWNIWCCAYVDGEWWNDCWFGVIFGHGCWLLDYKWCFVEEFCW